MGLTKTSLFTTEQNELAKVAKIFAHPARIAILQHLLKIKVCANGDFVEEIGLAQATISQHLRELKNIGIIQGTIEGVSVCYCIDPIGWEKIKKLFNTIFDQLDTCCSDDCC